MRQRIGLAQALINDPELVILDEPTSGLDPLGTRWMKNLIVDLRNQGKTIIMCSHRLEDVQDICDRIAILNKGELVAYGSVKTLLQDVNGGTAGGGLQLNDALQRDLEEVLRRHGGKLDVHRPSDHDAGGLLPAHPGGEKGSSGQALRAREGAGKGGQPRRGPPAIGSRSNVNMLALIIERDPLSYQDVPALLLSWVQDMGGFAAFFVAIWVVLVLTRIYPFNWRKVPARPGVVLQGLRHSRSPELPGPAVQPRAAVDGG